MAVKLIEPESSSKSHFDTRHLTADIKGRSVRGGAATILGHGATFIIHSASTVILARLLVPADFGLIAMVSAITGFVALFRDIGLSMATIQKAEINHEQVSTLFWVNVGAGALMAIVVGALAPAIAWFYNEPRLTLVTLSLALVFLIGGLTIQHNALLKRQMRFLAVEIIHIASSLISVGIAIVAAVMGAGYWALVIMQGASALGIAIGAWVVCDWRPGRPVRGVGAKKMLVFGGNITGFNVLNYFARHLDHILIGRVWGAGSLGFYSKAYGLLMLPLRQINMPIASVVIPALSRLHGDPARYKDYYLKMVSLITFVSTPLVCYFIVCSDALVLIILGPQWAEASKIFSVLGISALIQPLYFTQGWLHISAGRTDRYLRWGFVGSLIIVVGFLVGLPYGAFGVAVAYAVVSWVIIVPCMWYAGGSAGIRIGEIFTAVGKNIASGLGCIALTVILFKQGMFSQDIWTNLLVGLGSICLTYSMFLLIFYRNLKPWRQVIDVAITFIRPIMRKPSAVG